MTTKYDRAIMKVSCHGAPVGCVATMSAGARLALIKMVERYGVDQTLDVLTDACACLCTPGQPAPSPTPPGASAPATPANPNVPASVVTPTPATPASPPDCGTLPELPPFTTEL